MDVFIDNMDRPNEIWLNEDGQLLDSGLRFGADNDLSGKPSLGNLDADGDLDLIVGRFNGGADIWFNVGLVNRYAQGDILCSIQSLF